jgi:hypothetical protein
MDHGRLQEGAKMKPGDKVTVDLIKPEIMLSLELEEYWPYEPSNYCLQDQWLACEPDPPDEDSSYWIMSDGVVYHSIAGIKYSNMEVGTCPEVRDFYHRPDDEL